MVAATWDGTTSSASCSAPSHGSHRRPEDDHRLNLLGPIAVVLD